MGAATTSYAQPKFSATIVYRDDYSVIDGGVVSQGVLKINALIPLPINLVDVDEATSFELSVGELGDKWNWGVCLGKDPKYTVGQKTATISDNYNNLTLTWTATSLSITGSCTYSPWLNVVPYGEQRSFAGQVMEGIQVVFGSASLSVPHPYVYSGTNYVRDSGYSENSLPILLNNGRISITADFVPPTVAVSSPAQNTVVTNDSLPAVRFSARDIGGLGDPPFQVYLNGELQEVNPTFNSPTNATGVSYISGLQYGTNIIQISASDSAGNLTTTNLSVFYSHKVPVTDVVSKDGSGAVTGTPTSGMVELGRTYTLTATPGLGQTFAGWYFYSYGQLSWTAQENPIMVIFYEGDEILASFVPSPYPPLKGTYTGLFGPVEEPAQTPSISGAITITTTSSNSVSGKVTTSSGAYSFSGKFVYSPGDGVATAQLPLGSDRWVYLSLGTDVNVPENYGIMTGSVYFPNPGADPIWMDFTAGRITAVPLGYAGVYNFNFWPNPNPNYSGTPEGVTFGSATLATNGTVSLTLSVADSNAPVTLAGGMTADLRIPFFSPLYGTNGGIIMGYLDFANISPDSPGIEVEFGTAAWSKVPGKLFYPDGFAEFGMLAYGCKYVPMGTGPYFGTLSYGTKQKEVKIQNGTITVTDASGNEDNLTGKVTLATGEYSGTFKEGAATRAFKGRITGLCDGSVICGGGFFLGTNQSGFVYLEVAP